VKLSEVSRSAIVTVGRCCPCAFDDCSGCWLWMLASQCESAFVKMVKLMRIGGTY